MLQIQSFVAGVPYIVVGYRYEFANHSEDKLKKPLAIQVNITIFPFSSWCRDDGGKLVRTEMLKTKDIAHRARLKNFWQVSVISSSHYRHE